VAELPNQSYLFSDLFVLELEFFMTLCYENPGTEIFFWLTTPWHYTTVCIYNALDML